MMSITILPHRAAYVVINTDGAQTIFGFSADDDIAVGLDGNSLRQSEDLPLTIKAMAAAWTADNGKLCRLSI